MWQMTQSATGGVATGLSSDRFSDSDPQHAISAFPSWAGWPGGHQPPPPPPAATYTPMAAAAGQQPTSGPPQPWPTLAQRSQGMGTYGQSQWGEGLNPYMAWQSWAYPQGFQSHPAWQPQGFQQPPVPPPQQPIQSQVLAPVVEDDSVVENSSGGHRKRSHQDLWESRMEPPPVRRARSNYWDTSPAPSSSGGGDGSVEASPSALRASQRRDPGHLVCPVSAPDAGEGVPPTLSPQPRSTGPPSADLADPEEETDEVGLFRGTMRTVLARLELSPHQRPIEVDSWGGLVASQHEDPKAARLEWPQSDTILKIQERLLNTIRSAPSQSLEEHLALPSPKVEQVSAATRSSLPAPIAARLYKVRDVYDVTWPRAAPVSSILAPDQSKIPFHLDYKAVACWDNNIRDAAYAAVTQDRVVNALFTHIADQDARILELEAELPEGANPQLPVTLFKEEQLEQARHLVELSSASILTSLVASSTNVQLARREAALKSLPISSEDKARLRVVPMKGHDLFGPWAPDIMAWLNDKKSERRSRLLEDTTAALLQQQNRQLRQQPAEPKPNRRSGSKPGKRDYPGRAWAPLRGRGGAPRAKLSTASAPFRGAGGQGGRHGNRGAFNRPGQGRGRGAFRGRRQSFRGGRQAPPRKP